MAKIEVELAGIKECLKYIQRDVQTVNEKLDKMDDRVTASESKTTALETKVGLFAGLQTAFTVAVGFIANYLLPKN